MRKCFEALSPERWKTWVAFHAFTGCDQTGQFSNKSK